MKIVDVNGFYAGAGGGVRRYVDAKFAAAARAGLELTVIAPGEASCVEPREGGAVVWVEGPTMPFDPRYRLFGRREAVFAALDRVAPDLVEASSPWKSADLAVGWPGRAARVLVFHQDAVAAYGHTFLDRRDGCGRRMARRPTGGARRRQCASRSVRHRVRSVLV